jgi:hypothetical protein
MLAWDENIWASEDRGLVFSADRGTQIASADRGTQIASADKGTQTDDRWKLQALTEERQALYDRLGSIEKSLEEVRLIVSPAHGRTSDLRMWGRASRTALNVMAGLAYSTYNRVMRFVD